MPSAACRLFAILVAGSGVACRQHASADRSSTPPHAAAAPSADSARQGTSQPPDSLAFDYPIGYYIPTDTIEVNGYAVASIALPQGEIRLWQSVKDSSAVFDCPAPLIKPDTVDVQCPQTPIGNVHLRGAFTAVLHGWQNEDLGKHPILAGLVTIERAGKVLFAKRVNFTFWVGD